MQSVAHIFKLGQRARLLPFAPRVWAQLEGLLASPELASNALARKLSIKLCQRVGLTFLEPRLAQWRYLKEDVDLDAVLGGGERQQQQQQLVEEAGWSGGFEWTCA